MNEENTTKKSNNQKIIIAITLFFVLITSLTISSKNDKAIYNEWVESTKNAKEKVLTYDFVAQTNGRYGVTLLYLKEFKEPFRIDVHYDIFKDSIFTMKYYEFKNKQCVLSITAKYKDRDFEILSNKPLAISSDFTDHYCFDSL